MDLAPNTDISGSLQMQVTGERLEGDNQYWCQHCNQRRDALKRSVIEVDDSSYCMFRFNTIELQRLPKMLTLPLKRASYDYETLARVRVNHR